jgi:hypothetical protein
MKNEDSNFKSSNMYRIKYWIERIFRQLEKTDKKISIVQNHMRFIGWVFLTIAVLVGLIFGFDIGKFWSEYQDKKKYGEQLSEMGYEAKKSDANKALVDSNGTAIRLLSLVGIEPDIDILEKAFIESISTEQTNQALNAILETNSSISKNKQNPLNQLIRHAQSSIGYITKFSEKKLDLQLFCEDFPDTSISKIGKITIINRKNCDNLIQIGIFLESVLDLFIISEYSTNYISDSVPLTALSEPINPVDSLIAIIDASIRFKDNDYRPTQISEKYFKPMKRSGNINPSTGANIQMRYQIFYEFPDGDWFPQFYKIPIEEMFGINACPNHVKCPYDITYLEYKGNRYVIWVD